MEKDKFWICFLILFVCFFTIIMTLILSFVLRTLFNVSFWIIIPIVTLVGIKSGAITMSNVIKKALKQEEEIQE